jgi:hypothetical protein
MRDEPFTSRWHHDPPGLRAEQELPLWLKAAIWGVLITLSWTCVYIAALLAF